MDTTIEHEFFHGPLGDLTPDRIKARNCNCFGRVVDNDIDTGCQLERTNVAPVPSDDPSLHFVRR